MRIFNQEKTKELTMSEINLETGSLELDTLNGVDRQEEQIVIENGIEKRVLVPKTIEEKILVFIPFEKGKTVEESIVELEDWFVNVYELTVQKCERKLALGTKFKDGSDPAIKLQELYNEAEINAEKIHNLRLLLKKKKLK